MAPPSILWLSGTVDLHRWPQTLLSPVVLGSPSVRLKLAPVITLPASPLVGPLCDRIGLHRGLELLMRGCDLTATEALRIHLLDGVMDREEFEDWRSQLSRLSSQSQHLAVEMVQLQTASSQPAAEAAERAAFALVLALPDAQEGIRAFLEKRTPAFRP